MRHAFAARGSLSTMLNTSFGGSDVDDGNGDSCETGGWSESVTVESLLIVESLVIVDCG